jgi:hypothetical protein
MIRASFKSCSLKMLVDMLAVCSSEIIADGNKNVCVKELDLKKNIAKILKEIIVDKRAEYTR